MVVASSHERRGSGGGCAAAKTKQLRYHDNKSSKNRIDITGDDRNGNGSGGGERGGGGWTGSSGRNRRKEERENSSEASPREPARPEQRAGTVSAAHWAYTGLQCLRGLEELGPGNPAAAWWLPLVTEDVIKHKGSGVSNLVGSRQRGGACIERLPLNRESGAKTKISPRPGRGHVHRRCGGRRGRSRRRRAGEALRRLNPYHHLRRGPRSTASSLPSSHLRTRATAKHKRAHATRAPARAAA